MAIGILVIVLGIAVFGGMCLALYVAYRDTEAQRSKDRIPHS